MVSSSSLSKPADDKEMSSRGLGASSGRTRAVSELGFRDIEIDARGSTDDSSWPWSTEGSHGSGTIREEVAWVFSRCAINLVGFV
jgi:hypothetical protein